MKRQLLSFLASLIWGLYVCIAVVSCGDFLEGGNFKDTIESDIAREKAPWNTVLIKPEKGSGTVIKPAGEEAVVRASDTFTVKFEADSDYEFICWKAESASLKDNEDINDYIFIEDTDSAETNVTLKETLEDIIITPVVAKRAQIISWSPVLSSTFTLKDSPIRVVFDMRMDPASIYYTEDEIKNLKRELALTSNDFLSSGNNKYGYIKDGEKFYKNILIENAETGENLNCYFKAPVFDVHRKILIIEADLNNLPPDYTQIIVTLSKDFFYIKGYDEKAKIVKLNQEKKWLYYVNNRIDGSSPSTDKIQLECSVSGGEKFTPVSSTPHLSNDTDISKWGISDLSPKRGKSITLDMDFMIKDDGVGLTDSFEVKIYKFADNYKFNKEYKTDALLGEYTCKYNMRNMFLADYTGTLNVNSIVGNTELEDGGYAVAFIFRDRSGNSNDRYYYIYLDNSFNLDYITPSVNNHDYEESRYIFFGYYNKELKELKLKIKEADNEYNEFVLTYVEDEYNSLRLNCKKPDFGDSNLSIDDTLSNISSSIDIYGLNKSYDYIFTLTAEDYAGNQCRRIFSLNPSGVLTEVVQ